jgi:glycerophosphoryl diester phosphodiesterase
MATILAHRGDWRTRDEHNALPAFARAFASGWGVELDVRDRDGELVVSHDLPDAGSPPLAAVLELRGDEPLAVNVKADGLQERLAGVLRDGDFLFDMSVPDAVVCLKHGLPVFTRHSDVEPDPVLYDGSEGVWLDDFFDGRFVTEERIAAHLAAGKRVAVVSPELHGRDRASAWAEWRAWDVWSNPSVLLCTDAPAEAEEAFA